MEDLAPNQLQNALQPIMDQLAELQRQFGARGQSAGPTETPGDVIRSSEQPDLKETSIKGVGNKEQFRFCRVILNLVEAASKCFTENGGVTDVDTLKGFVQAIGKSTSKRVKLIKMADRSEFGWDVAKYYQTDSIVDNSDDERWIKSAERQAAAERKKSSKGKAKYSSGLKINILYSIVSDETFIYYVQSFQQANMLVKI